jgi:hypothetical protein
MIRNKGAEAPLFDLAYCSTVDALARVATASAAGTTGVAPTVPVASVTPVAFAVRESVFQA